MSGAITSTDFQEKATFGDAWIEEGTDLPNSRNYTSSAFDAGKVQSKLGIEVKANGAVAIANTKTLKIELLHDSSESGSYSDSITLLDYTNSSGDTVTRADGYVFVREVPSEEINRWCKLKITTTSDLSSYSYNAKVYIIGG